MRQRPRFFACADHRRWAEHSRHTRAKAGQRKDVFLATKLAPSPSGSGFARDEVRRGCEGSLERLGTDRIDLYQLHWPDSGTVPLDEWTRRIVDADEFARITHRPVLVYLNLMRE